MRSPEFRLSAFDAFTAAAKYTESGADAAVGAVHEYDQRLLPGVVVLVPARVCVISCGLVPEMIWVSLPVEAMLPAAFWLISMIREAKPNLVHPCSVTETFTVYVWPGLYVAGLPWMEMLAEPEPAGPEWHIPQVGLPNPLVTPEGAPELLVKTL